MKAVELSKNITKKNAAFIFLSYAKQAKHSLITDLTETVDKNGKTVNSTFGRKAMPGDKKTISFNLRTLIENTLLARAKELKIQGIDYDKIYEIDNPGQLSEFVDNVAKKVAEAEIKIKPELAGRVNPESAENNRQWDINKLEQDSQAIVTDLYKHIHHNI